MNCRRLVSQSYLFLFRFIIVVIFKITRLILIVDLKFLGRLGLIVDLADWCLVFTRVFIVAVIVIIFRAANGVIDDPFQIHARHIDEPDDRCAQTRSHNPRQNHLLDALPREQWERWRSQLEYVDMRLGQVLYEPGNTLTHVYFPTTAIVSLLYVMKNGESAEIAVVGNEGVVGVSLFMGGGSTSSRALVQSAGGAYRLSAELMKQEFDRAGPVLHLLLRYTQALMTQMVQTAACNKHHSLDQQLCRWLLLSLDRLQGTEMLMTPKLIAHMLGVSEEVATEGALKLQGAD
jgi:CRP-like cAMP-binding protein